SNRSFSSLRSLRLCVRLFFPRGGGASLKKFAAIVFIWALVLSGGAAAYYVLLQPQATGGGGGDGPPPKAAGAKLRLALDSFSGYCVFRSDEFKKKLAAKGID